MFMYVYVVCLCIYSASTCKCIFYPQKFEVHPLAPKERYISKQANSEIARRLFGYLGPLKVIVFHTETTISTSEKAEGWR